ncbi:ATPase, T2SS/T4P/T4SS family [Candidatus Omnitrophota bacterium]
MASNYDKILFNVLIDKGLIKEAQVDSAIKEADKTSQSFASVLIKNGLVPEEKVLLILSEKLNIPYVNLKGVSIETTAIDKVPLKFTTYYKFVPIKFENNVLTIAVFYPLDIKIQDEIKVYLGFDIEMVLASEADILEKLKIHYGLAADTIQKIISKTPTKQASDTGISEGRVVEDIEKLAGEASVIKLVSQIILEGYKRRATDIHLEPYMGKIRLRYRVDGILYSAPVPPEIKSFFNSILSRIKIMSSLNIVERRLPQDGRAIVKIGDQRLDLRVSFVPTPYGESVAIRILPTKMLFSLEKLGLEGTDLEKFEGLVKKTHGIIFVTGPTGSGKTTTLYACLSEINTDHRKMITIEDPIEYELEDVTQIQVQPVIGLDFARGLRSMLRHDPDVMMVGEVRDRETAEIAIRVALTGHLVFSTLHTNDAAGGIARLLNIGIESYLVASSVEAFIAQRLVRLLCPHCKLEDKNQPEQIKVLIAKDLSLASSKEIKVFKAEGCDKCNKTGFFGRTAIYEILLVDDAIRELIIKNASASEIRGMALKRGMRILRQDGWRKVLDGQTSPEEIMRATQEEKPIEQGEREVITRNNTSGEVESRSGVFQGRVVKDSSSQKSSGSQESEDAEERVYRRLNTEVNIEYKLVKSKIKSPVKSNIKLPKGKYLTQQFSITYNISAGGLFFVSSDPMPLGSILELRIALPDAAKHIECLGKVTRVEEVAAGKTYNISICFLDMPSAERARINKYIEEEFG